MSLGNHPDIAAALKTGYPRGVKTGNEDTKEARKEFAREDLSDFFQFVADNYSEVLDDYIENHEREYRDWLS